MKDWGFLGGEQAACPTPAYRHKTPLAGFAAGVREKARYILEQAVSGTATVGNNGPSAGLPPHDEWR